MLDLIPTFARRFIEPAERYNFKRNLLGLYLSGLMVTVGICQTELFVSLFPGAPDPKTIRIHMDTCQHLQQKLKKGCCKPKSGEPGDGITFELFSEDNVKRLKWAKDSLVNDHRLQLELQEKFGSSFENLQVVVVPAWQMDTVDNNPIIGITLQGWRQANIAKGEPNVGGCTLRDRPSDKQPITIDGRPRIVLNLKAFDSLDALRLTLFHELLHAMNVPGIYPCPITFAQNDLTYLPEYRDYVKKENLQGWYETKIWVLAVILPLMIFAILFTRVLHGVNTQTKYATGEDSARDE